MKLENKIKKEIDFLKKQIKKGKEPNMNNIDGWTMQGLEEKLEILEDCFFKLTKSTIFIPKNNYE